MRWLACSRTRRVSDCWRSAGVPRLHGRPDGTQVRGRPASPTSCSFAGSASWHPATPCSARRAPTTGAGSARSGSGSSTLSTARASSARSRVRTGRSTSPCGSTASWPRVRSRCRPPASPLAPTTRRRPRTGPWTASGSPSAAPGRRPSSSSWPRLSTPSWCRWARLGSRRCPCCATRPTPTSTRAASSSGTRPPRSLSPGPPGCTPAGSTAPRCATTSPNPSLPDLVVCRPDLAERILEAIATVRSSPSPRSTKGPFA